MITAIVQFDLPAGMTLADATEKFRDSAPRYQQMPGLIRKYYLFGDGVGGGVYLWETRAAAEAVYEGPWRDGIRERFGVDPSITYFDSPVIVDNTSGEIQVAA